MVPKHPNMPSQEYLIEYNNAAEEFQLQAE
jgi:hypothetical protein